MMTYLGTFVLRTFCVSRPISSDHHHILHTLEGSVFDVLVFLNLDHLYNNDDDTYIFK